MVVWGLQSWAGICLACSPTTAITSFALKAGEEGISASHCGPFLPPRGASPSLLTSPMPKLQVEGAKKGMHRETGWCGKLCSFGIFLLNEAISGGGKEVSECVGDGSGHSGQLWRCYRSQELAGLKTGPRACRLYLGGCRESWT